jgi:hypothetical protein
MNVGIGNFPNSRAEWQKRRRGYNYRRLFGLT